jgi:hypothetical protein
MSWLYSQALVVEYLGENFSDGEQSAPLNGNPIQQAYCAPDKMTDFSRLSRYGMMYKPLTESLGQELLTLYLAGFHAKTLAQQEKVTGLTENEAECGSTWRGWLAKYDPDLCLWKTAQCSLLEGEQELLETLPKWGMTVNGLLWELPTLGQITKGIGCGLSEQMWPTPCATDHKGSGKTGTLRDRLDYAAERGATKTKTYTWPTPRTAGMCGGTGSWQLLNKNTTKEEARQMGAGNGGKLNPTWVEWLMGWPLEWTDLKPSEMDKSHSVRQQLGES